MNRITAIGIDLAKNIFQIHGVDAKGRVLLRKRLKREQVALFFANLPACLVGMESCATSAYWARVIESCGHTVRRIPPQIAKPYLMNNKTDANDAAAICEALQRPHMRFVPHKSQEQADIQALHRVRKRLIQGRTATINQIRGLLAENGIVIRQGACHIRSQLPILLDDLDNELFGVMRELLFSLMEVMRFHDEQIARLDRRLRAISKENEACRRLMKIPGIGPLTSTILLTAIGRAGDFKNGREFAAFLGLVPRQYSSGGKNKLLGISKRGDANVRTFLLHGSRAVLRSVKRGGRPLGDGATTAWLVELMERRGHNRASVALANKMARTAWAMAVKGTEYQMAV
jgi:transposase